MSLNEFPLILVYYRFRGLLQPIRNLYCYLELPFIELQLDHIEDQKKFLSPVIIQHISKLKIDKSQLPVLIHGNLVVEGVYPIVVYSCKKFNGEALMGSSIFIRAKLQEIMQIYLLKQPQVLNSFFALAEIAATKSPQITNEQAKRLYQNTLKESKFVKEICQYLDQQQNKGYIFGELTLIDFFFLETCVYMNGIYSHPDRNNAKVLEQWDKANSSFLNKPNAYYLTIMQDYELRLKNQPWYTKNQEYLESFSIISTILPQNRAKGLKKLWVGNPKTVN